MTSQHAPADASVSGEEPAAAPGSVGGRALQVAPDQPPEDGPLLTAEDDPPLSAEDLAQRDSDREYLCQSYLATLAAGLLIGGWVWGVALIATRTIGSPTAQWASPVALILSGWLAMRWAERRLGLATAVALGGLLGAFGWASWVAETPLYGLGLILTLLAAGVLASPLAITLIAAASLGWIVAAPTLFAADLSLTWGLGLGVLASYALSRLLYHFIYVALELSWESRQAALRELRSAQQRRGELQRALKAVDEGYARLQRLNAELIETRREADEARGLKEEFAANVSHELRTPINLIVGFSEMMVTAPESYSGQALPSEYLGDVHAIYRSARHLQSLIDDILDLSRMDAHQMSLAREWLDLPDIAFEAAALVRELVERKGLTLRVEMAEGLPQVMVDRTRIRQVLLNLLSNAIRFTEQGHIAVRCEMHVHDQGRSANGTPLDHALAQGIALPEQPFVCVSVTDTGIGIRSEDMAAVFEKFRQVDGSSRRKVGGTGLGLAISKQFVELHGGWMWVESVYGQGSTFCFVLPAAGHAWVRSPLLDTGRRAPALPVGKAILVVDPDPRLGRLLERYLPTRRVIAVPELAQAGRALAETMPEVVLARVEVPRAEIEALCASLGLANAELTVVRAGQDDAGLPATGEGIHDYLLKPVVREDLEASLRRLEHRPKRILIVEDDPDMMRLLVRLTARLAPGARLQRAYSVQEAQAALQEAPPPELVMLDLGLPDQSGYDLLHWMRHTHGLDAPVIIITGNPDPDMAALRLPEVAVWRPRGLSAPELVTLLDLLVEKLPSTYAARHSRASGRRDKAKTS